MLTRGKLVLTENEVGALVLIRGELVPTENGVRALVLARGELVLMENGDWGRGTGIDQGRIGTVALTLEKEDWGWGSSNKHDMMVDRKGFWVDFVPTIKRGGGIYLLKSKLHTSL